MRCPWEPLESSNLFLWVLEPIHNFKTVHMPRKKPILFSEYPQHLHGQKVKDKMELETASRSLETKHTHILPITTHEAQKMLGGY